MANVTINDEHLIAIGETLRAKLGETRVETVVTQNPLPLVEASSGSTGHDSLGSYVTYSTSYESFTVPGANSIKIKCTSDFNSSSNTLAATSGIVTSFTYGTNLYNSYTNIGSANTKEVTISGTESVTIKFYGKMKVYMEIFGLDADGNEMPYWETSAEGEVANTFKPRDMAGAIDQLGYIAPIVLTGSCAYGCSGATGSAYLDLCDESSISTSDITNMNYMFGYNTAESIPFDINCLESANYINAEYMFQHAENLKTLPAINNFKVGNTRFMFGYCYELAEIPEGYANTWDWSYVQAAINYYNYTSAMFYECRKLRRIDSSFLENMWTSGKSTTYSSYYQAFYNCYSLDEVMGLGVNTVTAVSSNVFSGTFSNCARLKNFTFKTNEDGSAQVAQWKSLTLDLTGVGYSSSASNFTLNTDFTTDTQVTDLFSYEDLKDNPDWWTANKTFSRYNHDSAVATINSLPDCSATGTNTIKFLGTMGSGYGKAISDLTEAEIAVATAKGWTVSIT